MENRSRIHLISKIMQFACLAIAVLIVAFQLYFIVMIRFAPDFVMPVVVERRIAEEIIAAGFLSYLVAALLFTLPSFVMSYAIWLLAKMFRSFREGEYFSEKGASYLLLFSFLGLATQILTPVVEAVAGAVARMGTGENFIAFSFTIDRDSLVQLLAWGTFFAVAWILREGVQLARENAEFV